MASIHNLGFPRIGKQRELKFALESYWQGENSKEDLLATASQIRQNNWQQQAHLDLVPVGDFSFYDQVLDTSLLVGNLPDRVNSDDNQLEQYFQAARGRSSNQGHQTYAAEMTKWFDSNYHYLVPEFTKETRFSLNAEGLIEQIKQCQALGNKAKPVLIGPLTYLWLGKSKDGVNKLDLLNDLVIVYQQLLDQLSELNIDWVQIDEPILVTELEPQWVHGFKQAYLALNRSPINILLASYFGQLKENLLFVCELPVAGLHIDAINGLAEVDKVIDWLPKHKVLSLGVINGRNIWKTDLNKTLDWLEPIAERLNNRLWLAPSCSLLHVPVDLDAEQNLDSEVKNWLAFAIQKLAELEVLGAALNQGRDSVKQQLANNQQDIEQRKNSVKTNNPAVKQRVESANNIRHQRNSSYADRAEVQREKLQLPAFPTTTIGSFPQTKQIRGVRQQYRNNKIDHADYKKAMELEINHAIEQQLAIGLDVLVHGEPERNDMVEYFGEQLSGYVFSQFGWVQSYGSRCVKPPILFGDIERKQPITVEWAKYAQSLTNKPVKGMLTGPVTILNWSFVRDDQPRSETCLQLALAIRDEVLDLEHAGIDIIQIDEAALREGLPLRQSEWHDYLDWAINSFKVTANGVKDDTQIHTHMCYSEFNDIIESIANMDADVITIETSRSDMELLDVFNEFNYPNEIGPGVYDIHSPNIPDVSQIVTLMEKASQRLPIERLWVNPDCGLKTRKWDEVRPALIAMVEASQLLRQKYT